MTRLRKSLTVLFLLALALPAQAETYTVVNSDSSGSGSLYWAVNSVNANNTAGHTISFDARIKHITIPQELTLNKSVTIKGGGATLERSGSGRLFTITDGRAEFECLTFTKGYAVSDNGGAVKIEGSGASAGFTNCTFFNNHADNYGGAVCITNGSLTPRTTLTHCTISGNLAANGGGFAVLNGRAEIAATIITGNTVSYDVYTASSAGIISDYNIFGTANFEPGETTLTGASASEVFFTNTLEDAGGVEVLRLSGTSPARDFINVSQGYSEVDETGGARPMLSGYDAGAFEARPVPVESAGISGIPYLQVNSTENFALSITPSDASLNVTEYPPHGAVWQSSNPAVISVDNSGTVKALSVGSAYITAAVYGWDASGNPLSPSATSKAFRVYAGEEPRNPMKATVLSIDEVSVRPGSYILVKPVVSLDINGIILENPSGGVNYSLSAESSRLDIVTAEIVSGDTVRLLGGSEVSEVSCDVTVKARPLPEGTEGSTVFTVNVTGSAGNGGDTGHSKGGGGCTLSMAGILALTLLYRRVKH